MYGVCVYIYTHVYIHMHMHIHIHVYNDEWEVEMICSYFQREHWNCHCHIVARTCHVRGRGGVTVCQLSTRDTREFFCQISKSLLLTWYMEEGDDHDRYHWQCEEGGEGETEMLKL